MRFAVFGSTGGNGRLVLAEGVRHGHEVTAFARKASASLVWPAWPKWSRATGATGARSRRPSSAKPP